VPPGGARARARAQAGARARCRREAFECKQRITCTTLRVFWRRTRACRIIERQRSIDSTSPASPWRACAWADGSVSQMRAHDERVDTVCRLFGPCIYRPCARTRRSSHRSFLASMAPYIALSLHPLLLALLLPCIAPYIARLALILPWLGHHRASIKHSSAADAKPSADKHTRS
jgi:hypothetical protein